VVRHIKDRDIKRVFMGRLPPVELVGGYLS